MEKHVVVHLIGGMIQEKHVVISGIHVSDLNFSKDNKLKDAREVTHAGPDVATAIEDLLEQTSKVKMFSRKMFIVVVVSPFRLCLVFRRFD